MTLLTLPLIALLASVASPDDGGDAWPGWRGPAGNGLAPGSPPVRWSEEEGVRWKAPLPGRGLSSPVVWGDRVFVTTAVPTGKVVEPAAGGEGGAGERGRRGGRGGGRGSRGPLAEQELLVLAFDRADGAPVWRRSAGVRMPHQGTHSDSTYATPTLVTDGEVLVASFGSLGIWACDLDGEELWSVDLGDMDITNGFGEGASMALHGDRLIVPWDHDGDSFVVALHRKTGKELWRRERPRGTNWSTPLVVTTEIGSEPTAQVILAGTPLVAYDVATGEELWTFGEAPPSEPVESGFRGRGPRRSGTITSPVVHEGVMYVTTGGRRGGTFSAIRLADARGKVDGTDAVLWSFDGETPRISSPLVHDGLFYSIKSTSGILTTYDASSGERVYGPERLEGVTDVYASAVLADGRIYLAGRDGTVEVIAAGPEPTTLAVNTLDDTLDASPAVAGDELFLRGAKHLYCIAAD